MKKIILVFILLFSMQNETTAQKATYTIGTTQSFNDLGVATSSMWLYKDAVVAHKIESESHRTMAMFIRNDQNDIYVFTEAILNEKYSQMNVLKNNQMLYSIAKDSASIRIKDVCIYNSDVYLAGASSTMKSNDRSISYNIWKNGEILDSIRTNSTELDITEISAICVNEGNIYVAGLVEGKDRIKERKHQVAVWKNGELIYVLPEGRSNLAKAKDIIVYNEDIYILGEGLISGFNPNALVWKNGKLIYTSPERATAVKMIESEGSIYLLGQYPRKTTQIYVLKDFQPLFEIEEKKDCKASSIFVDSGNVYISGQIVERGDSPKLGKLWKNGQTLYSYKGIGKEKYIHIKGLLVF